MKSTSLFVLAAISLVYAQAPPDKSVNVSGTKATLTTSKPGVSTNNKSAAPYTCPKGEFVLPFGTLLTYVRTIFDLWYRHRGNWRRQ
jgi:hypothetical protein